MPILKLLIYEYLEQISPRKEIKEVFSVKLHTENLCFWLRQQLIEKPKAAQIRTIIPSSRPLIRVSSDFPEVKKICIYKWLGKYSCILGRVKQSQALAKYFGLFQMQLVDIAVAQPQEYFATFILI